MLVQTLILMLLQAQAALGIQELMDVLHGTTYGIGDAKFDIDIFSVQLVVAVAQVV